MIFPADGALLNFFILRNVVWSFHWLLLGFGFQVVDSGFIPCDSVWQEAVTSSIILVQKNWQLLSFSAVVLSLSLHQSAWVALKECRPWNSLVFNLLPLYSLFQWIVYSIIHQKWHDGYCISVHQPDKCEESLQCRYSHLVSVMKCCCSCFSFCNPCYPSYSTCSEMSFDQSIYFHFNKPFHTLPSPASLWQWADKSYIHTYGCSAVANKNTVNYQVCSESFLLSVSRDAKHNVCIFHKVFIHK